MPAVVSLSDAVLQAGLEDKSVVDIYEAPP